MKSTRVKGELASTQEIKKFGEKDLYAKCIMQGDRVLHVLEVVVCGKLIKNPVPRK